MSKVANSESQVAVRRTLSAHSTEKGQVGGVQQIGKSEERDSNAAGGTQREMCKWTLGKAACRGGIEGADCRNRAETRCEAQPDQ